MAAAAAASAFSQDGMGLSSGAVGLDVGSTRSGEVLPAEVSVSRRMPKTLLSDMIGSFCDKRSTESRR